MLARLWWKEFRLFWPVWLCITLCALVAQWMAVWFFGNEAKTGVLMLVALGWAFLYATAVSASAFAGEREQRTLRFLDTLPVPRGFLWRSKASFALVTTLVFGLLLLLISMLSTDLETKPGYFNPVGSFSNFFSCFVLLIEALGWGLLWSAIMGNPLSASAMTVASVGVVVPLLMRQADLNPDWWSDAIIPRLVVAALTTLASLLIMTRKPRPSPLPRAPRVQPAQSREPSPTTSLPSKSPRFWLTATRSIVWETIREMRGPLAFVVLALFVAPLFFIVSGTIDETIAMVIGVFATIGAGVNVFGAENRGKTHRFLAHHGVGPGVVWTVKMGLWSLAMVCIWIPGFFLFAPRMPGGQNGVLPASALILIAVWTVGYSVAQLCGMVIKRGMTAGLVAFMLTLLILLTLSALHSFGLISVGQAAVIPLGLVLISRIWCGDWINDRPGARPWIKLGLSIVGVFGLMFVGYVWNRANEIPVLSPRIMADLLLPSTPAKIDESKNAAPLYLAAERKLRISDDVAYNEGIELLRKASTLPYCRFADALKQTTSLSTEGNDSTASGYQKLNSYFDGLLREQLKKGTLDKAGNDILQLMMTNATAHSSVVSRQFLSFQFERVIRDSLERGEFDKAWIDILALLRMGRHFQVGVPMSEAVQGLGTETSAMDLAIEWASDGRVTPDAIEHALKDLKALPMPEPAENAIREEWAVMKGTVRLPKERLRGVMETAFLDRLGGNGFFDRKGSAGKNWSAGLLSLVLTPWEIGRADRVIDELFAAKVLEARSEPFRRYYPMGWLYHGWEPAYYTTPEGDFNRSPWQLESDLQTTAIAKFLSFPFDNFLRSSDRTEAIRRGLLQFVALRSWQLKHDGNLPERLAEIVPIELDELPRDPFSNNPYLYVRSEGEWIQPIWENRGGDSNQVYSEKATGRRLLISVGEDREVFTKRGLGVYSDDIVFVLPAAKNDPPIVPRIEREIPRVENEPANGMEEMMGGMVEETKPQEPKTEKKKEEEPRM